MPRAALYEIMVLSLCNALVGAAVGMSIPASFSAVGFGVLVGLCWFASMFLVWWRVVLRGRMRFTWPGCVAAAIGAGLLGHLTFHLFVVGLLTLPREGLLPVVAKFFVYLVLVLAGSLALYGVQTVLLGVLLGTLLFAWKKKARGMTRLAARCAVR